MFVSFEPSGKFVFEKQPNPVLLTLVTVITELTWKALIGLVKIGKLQANSASCWPFEAGGAR